MGSVTSKEQSIVTALDDQDAAELRTILKDSSPEEIRNLCKSYVTSDENQCTILHYAAWQDNPELLAPLLDYADDLEMRDDLGWTPLMTAVNRGSKQNANLLLARGARVDCDWVGGMSLIGDAMSCNDIDLVVLLMDHGARVAPTAEMLSNSDDQNAFYLLHYAVDDGLIDMAKLLIEKGHIPLNTLDQSGWSALHLAAGHDYVEMVTLLIEKGADINIKDSEGNTPLAWAREMNAYGALNELRKYGAIADKEWHGNRPEMKTYEERAEEALTENTYEQETENQPSQDTVNGVGYDRFEIETETSKSQTSPKLNGNKSNTLDGLQRQRQIPNITV